MKRVGRKALVIAGWLLTPIVAGAASFLGAWLGAQLAPMLPPGGSGLVEMIALGALLAVGTVYVWLARLRRLGRPPASAPRTASAERRDPSA